MSLRECAQGPWVLIVNSIDFPGEFAEGDGLLNAWSISANVGFPGKSFPLHDIVARVTWLPLALEGPFLGLTGTIRGTARPSGEYPFMSNIDKTRYRV